MFSREGCTKSPSFSHEGCAKSPLGPDPASAEINRNHHFCFGLLGLSPLSPVNGRDVPRRRI